jgi:heat-inducible transcriptional repressor
MIDMETRQLDILRAIVEEYVATEEPVGSKAISQRHGLGISPATIRNEMSVLEDAGLITQPHTSAGRIPTDKGYRLFVDKIATVKPLSNAERRAIETFLEGANDLDDIVMRTVRLLAQVTKQVAVVQYPSLTKSRVRHIELVLLTPTRLMMVLITNTGRVEQRVLERPYELNEQLLGDLRQRLNGAVTGKSMSDVAPQLEGILAAFGRNERTSTALIISNLIEMAIEKPEEKVVLAGTANLARGTGESSDIHGILEALEEQVVLLRLLSDAGETMRVRIGEEQDESGLKRTSLVTMSYGVEGNPLGGLGILGPTRMDYSSSMSAVNAVARYVGRFLIDSQS